MDTPAPSPTAVRSRPRWPSALSVPWRFSIRELLLLTTAVAALVAVVLAYYRDSQPFSRSQLSQEFGSGRHIREAAARLHSHVVLINGGGGGGGDQRTLTQEYGYSIGLPPAARGQFMAQLHSDAQKMLNKDRPRFTGSRTGGNDLTHFSYSYHGGASRGVVVVRRTDLSDEEMQLTILIYEHEDR